MTFCIAQLLLFCLFGSRVAVEQENLKESIGRHLELFKMHYPDLISEFEVLSLMLQVEKDQRASPLYLHQLITFKNQENNVFLKSLRESSMMEQETPDFLRIQKMKQQDMSDFHQKILMGQIQVRQVRA